jgi:stearoyl-CoA desaturase (delta-9 desaturase)
LAVVLLATHLTILSVTLFLHRAQAHRALDLHPAVSHLMRFWLWLTTGMVTREWVAIHRKHHAKCETAEDPHSPVSKGLSTVLLRGSELYRAEAKNAETLAKYSHGVPDDWMERHVYTRHSFLGVALLLVLLLTLFGAWGASMWALIQMAWIPHPCRRRHQRPGPLVGLSQFRVARYLDQPDAAGLWIGGEELHNNHHTFPTSAKFSVRRFEVDIGWGYIRLLQAFGLAKPRKLTAQGRRGRDPAGGPAHAGGLDRQPLRGDGALRTRTAGHLPRRTAAVEGQGRAPQRAVAAVQVGQALAAARQPAHPAGSTCSWRRRARPARCWNRW